MNKLWIIAGSLAFAVFVILVLGTASNSSKIDELQKRRSFVFTFNQNGDTFKVFCEEDLNNPTVYICSTAKVH